MKNGEGKMVTRVDEINTAVQAVVDLEITSLKSTYFLDLHEKC